MSFYPRSGRRQQGGYMSSGWSQQPWSQTSSIFNMNPLDVISKFMSPVLDIVSPLEDLRSLMSQGGRMFGPSVLPKIVQQNKRKWTMQRGGSGQLLPQKYRIVIDCKGIVDPNSLKTNIKCVQDCVHLIVSSDVAHKRQQQQQVQPFKRSYTLPVECDTKKMSKFVTPTGQLVIEFNYMDVPLSLAIAPEHEICTTPEHGKCVHVRVPIADFVEPAKVKVHVRARDLYVHFEERIVPCGDFCARVIYHTRVQLPRNCDLNGITAKCDKHKLILLAPIGVKSTTPVSQQLRDIAVKRKLRHRKARAVSVGAEQKQQQQQQPQVSTGVTDQKKQKQVQPSIGGDKLKKSPLDTSTKPTTPIDIGLGQQQQQQQQQQPLISKKKQKKQNLLDQPQPQPQTSSISKPDVTPSISKPTDVTSNISSQQKPAQQLPVASTQDKKKKKNKSKKLTDTSTSSTSTMPTGADTSTMSATSTSQDQSKDVLPSSSSIDVNKDVGKVGDVSAHDITPTPPVDVGSRNIQDRGQQQDINRRSPVSDRPTNKGSDILKNIFADQPSSQQQGSQSTTSTTQSTDLSSSDRDRSSAANLSGPITL